MLEYLIYCPHNDSEDEPLLIRQHLDRYDFAAEFLAGDETVLDAACGSGYGSQMLSTKAKMVLGLDRSGHAVDFAQEHKTNANLEFQIGDLSERLVFPDGYFDTIVSFETLEHIGDQEDQESMLSEFKRVLRRGGRLIISTPDRDLVSGGLESDNPFHVRELDKREFIDLLSKFFSVQSLYGQTGVARLALWKRFLKGFRSLTPLRKFKQFVVRKLGMENVVHRQFSAEVHTPIEEISRDGPAEFYFLIAVCKRV